MAECVSQIHTDHMKMIGYEDSSYLLYEDDGYTRDYDLEGNSRRMG